MKSVHVLLVVLVGASASSMNATFSAFQQNFGKELVAVTNDVMFYTFSQLKVTFTAQPLSVTTDVCHFRRGRLHQ
jgi:hypothetical protein